MYGFLLQLLSKIREIVCRAYLFEEYVLIHFEQELALVLDMSVHIGLVSKVDLMFLQMINFFFWEAFIVWGLTWYEKSCRDSIYLKTLYAYR